MDLNQHTVTDFRKLRTKPPMPLIKEAMLFSAATSMECTTVTYRCPFRNEHIRLPAESVWHFFDAAGREVAIWSAGCPRELTYHPRPRTWKQERRAVNFAVSTADLACADES